MKISFILGCATLVFVSPVVAQSQERDPAAAVESFLTQRAEVQQRRATTLTNRGIGGELSGLNGLIRAVAVQMPAPEAANNAELRTRLADSFVTDIAQYLAIHGVRTGDIRRAGTESSETVQAAARIVRGTAEISDYQRFSDLSFLGELESVEFDSTPTGPYRSSAVVRVISPLKGRISTGDRVIIRQGSGREGANGFITDEHDFLPNQAGTFLVNVSSNRYVNTSDSSSSNANRQIYAHVLVPLKVEGDTVLPLQTVPSANVGSLLNQ